MKDAMRLAQSLNEKLCHDLAGIVGSINLALSILGSSGSSKQKVTELIGINSDKLINYLKFYRHLYANTADEYDISLEEVKNLSQKFLNSSNYNIKLEFNRSLNINSNISKILFGLIYCAANDLVQIGDIKVTINRLNDKFNLKLVAKGKNLKFNQSTANILLGKSAIQTLEMHNACEYYLYYLAQSLGYTLSVTQVDDTVEYRCVHGVSNEDK